MSLQEKLHSLFLLDQQVRGLRSRLDSATARLKTQSAKLDHLSRQGSELNQQYKQVQVQASSLETQALALEEKINQLRLHMNSAKSNKEYSALLVEVNTLKTEKKKIEDQALEQMGRVEALKQEAADVDSRIEQQKKIAEVAKGEVEKAMAEVGQRLSEETARREVAAAELPTDVRDQFNRLADAYEGEALVEVHEQSRKHMEYTCGGCYMIIPVEKVNTLMMRPDELVTCPGCRRMLYLGEELRGSFSQTK